MKNRILNEIRLGAFTALLGAACGAVIWLFLKVLGLCTSLLWDVLPQAAGTPYLPLGFCAAGGLIAGLLRRRFGDYPEELPVVLGRIKSTRRYDYHPMGIMLLCAFLPLVFGSSVGPEAGLTGVIAGLRCWVGDNVRYAKEHAEEYSEIGAAVTLGSLFHVPLFGIFAVEEDPGEAGRPLPGKKLPRTSRLVLYGISIAAAFLMMKLLGFFFGAAAEGPGAFEEVSSGAADYILFIIYVPAGILLFLAYQGAQKVTAFAAARVPGILRETLCGLCVGAMSLLVPSVLFSGEEQLGELPRMLLYCTPAALAGLCLLKILMTAFCIRFGLKGGHFFPFIFACSCMGAAIASLIFGSLAGISDASLIQSHAVFAAAAVTAAALGAQLRKPFAVSVLLLLCFPLKLVLWTFLAAAAGSKAGALLTRGKSRPDSLNPAYEKSPDPGPEAAPADETL